MKSLKTLKITVFPERLKGGVFLKTITRSPGESLALEELEVMASNDDYDDNNEDYNGEEEIGSFLEVLHGNKLRKFLINVFYLEINMSLFKRMPNLVKLNLESKTDSALVPGLLGLTNLEKLKVYEMMESEFLFLIKGLYKLVALDTVKEGRYRQKTMEEAEVFLKQVNRKLRVNKTWLC